SDAFADSKPEQLRIQAQLIWGTNDDKGKDSSYKEIDPKLRSKLQAVFKWRNYFEVNQQVVSVPVNKAKKINLSTKCEAEVLNKGGSLIEAKLYGDGKLRATQRHKMTTGETLTLASD